MTGSSWRPTDDDAWKNIVDSQVQINKTRLSKWTKWSFKIRIRIKIILLEKNNPNNSREMEQYIYSQLG